VARHDHDARRRGLIVTTLGHVLDRLEPAVLRAVLPADDAEREREVRDVVLFDGSSPAEVGPGDLVLGVGLTRPEQVGPALHALAARRPAAVVMRASLASAAEGGALVLAVDDSASWMHVTLIVRELLEGNGDGPDRGVSGDDLFQLADAIAAVAGGPVTVEDQQSRVLAFSEDQEGADEARRLTILGRRAPDAYQSRMKQRGVYRQLRQATAPIFVPGRKPDTKARLVLPVRAGGELLGSVWVVVDEEPSADVQSALAVVAPTVALHLLRQRASAHSWRSAEISALTTLLGGGSVADETARRLRLEGSGFQVVAVVGRGGDRLDEEALLMRLWDGLGLSLSVAFPHAVVGKVEQTLFAVVPHRERAQEVRPVLQRFLKVHAPGRAKDVAVGIGPVVPRCADLGRSHDYAMRVVDVLRAEPSRGPIADVVDVGPAALMRHVMTAINDVPDLGAGGLERLEEHDHDKGTAYRDTVLAWLDAFGNTDVAADELAVHPNTVRYRIRQLRELGLVDMEDPMERLALLLHLQRRRSSQQ
jgi:hypothetical protein